MQRMFVACNDANASVGIRCFALSTTTGEMHLTGETRDIGTCLYLCQHPVLPIVYAVGTRHDDAVIQAFRVEPDGALAPMGEQPTLGIEPCYVSVTPDGRFALVANYTGPQKAGSIVTFPLEPDGRIRPAAMQIQLSGHGVHTRRQEAAHPHMIGPTPDGRFVLVPDLGTDRLMIYRIDAETGRLEPHVQPYLAIQSGSGPRHVACHPHRQVLFLVSELEPLLTVIAYDEAGHFTIVDTYPTLPPDVAITVNLGADVHVAPSGRFVYVSNRGHDSLCIYALDSATDTLSYIGHQSTLGHWPRGFGIDPGGRVLVVANQHTNDLHTFHLDVGTGLLSETPHVATAPAPVCVLFMT